MTIILFEKTSSSRHSGGGREKEFEFEFEFCIEKSRCKMLIGEDDIRNDVISLSMFVYIRARFPFALIGGNLRAQLTGSHGGIEGGIQIPETQFQGLLPFPAPPPERPKELHRRLLLTTRNEISACKPNVNLFCLLRSS